MGITSFEKWFQQVINDPLCRYYILFQIVIFLFFGLWILIPVLRRKGQLTWSIRQIDERFDSNKSVSEIRKFIEMNISNQIDWIKHLFRAFSIAWKDACTDDAERASVPIRIKEFLTPTVVLDGVRNQRITAALPGIYVSIGIFGTFLGIVLGINEIDWNNLGNMKSGIYKLIDGLSLAFSTSLVGIFTSMIFSIAYRFSISSLETSLLRFDDIIARVYPYSSHERFASQYLETQKDIKQGIQTLATDLAVKLADTIGPAISDAVEEKLIPSLNQMFELVTKSFEENRNSQSKFMEESMNQYSSILNENFKDQFKDITEVFKETIGVQEEIREQMISFTANMQKQFESQEQLIEKTGRAAQLLNESLESLGTISRELKDSANDVSTAASLLQESAEKAKEGHEVLNETMEKQISTISSSQESFKSSWDVITDNTEGVVELIRAAIGELGTGISENLSKALDLYDSKIAEVAERFSGTLFEANQTIEELPHLMNQLEAVLQSTNNGIELQKELISGFGESLSSLVAPNIEKALQTAVSFQETSGDLEKTTSMLADISTEMQNSIRDSIEGLVDNLKPFEDGGSLHVLFTDLNSNLEKTTLGESEESLKVEKSLSTLNDNLLKIVDQMQKENGDKSIANGGGSLDQVAALNDVVEGLKETIIGISAVGGNGVNAEVLDNFKIINSKLERFATGIGKDSLELLTKINDSTGSVEGAINKLNQSIVTIQNSSESRKGFFGRIIGK
ncbi:MAG: MotA/TolQ/ExbB proton channel family protein [SAR324 cluster bacterium]|nr:MotA/TolQ/ExbB proton channel family protein [SAR324 cluster bacterium]